MRFEHFIGIDVAKDKFDIDHQDKNQKFSPQQFSNSISGISRLINYLTSKEIMPDNALICLEHTGNYIDQMTRILCGEGYFVWVVTPLFLKEFSPKKLRLENDMVAARKLAEYARYFHEMAVRFVPDTPYQDRLKKLFRLRNQLVKARASAANRKASNQDLSNPDLLTDQVWTEAIDSFTQRIEQVDQLLKRAFLEDPEYRRMYKLLQTVPGIGKVCAAQLLIMTRGFTKFNNHKAFASFISTAPFEKASGKRHRKPRIHKAGHKQIKANLFMASLRHIRPGGFFHEEYFEKTQEFGKHHNSVMNSFINRLLKIVFDIIRLDEPFDHAKYLAGKKKMG